MKSLELLEMEEVFILTGIWILIVGVSLGLLISWLLIRGEKKGRDHE